jgi:hypothetical protein
MNRHSFELVAAVFAVLVLPGWTAAAELELEPCTIELVDGTTVEGHLAVQFEMDDHLIVYSPRRATVRSFLKDHVHALTVDGEREQFNPKRDLTDEDRKLLGRVEWPDAAPGSGRRPAYTTQTWAKPGRLIVWKDPGRSGLMHDPANWIIIGGDANSIWPPLDTINPRNLNVSWLGVDTDVVMPLAAESYQAKVRVRPAGIIECRHVTVERNAALHVSTVPAMTGNLWATRDGAFRSRYTTNFTGSRHTFFFNDQPRLTPQSPGAKPVRRGYIIPVEGPYSAAQYLTVRKTDDASVEFVGTIVSSDDFQLARGTAIVAENSQFWPGTRSMQHLRYGTTLRLMSGAEYGKAHTAAGSGYDFKYNQGAIDVVISGRIEAGTKEHPITEDVEFGISFKAPAGFRDLDHQVPGAVICPGAQIIVHTADPDKAKLVFDWHQRHNAWYEGRLDGYKQMPEQITIGICGQIMLENVKFNDLARDGLMLEHPQVAMRWKNVTFGDRCAGDRDQLITRWPDALRSAIVSNDWYRHASADQ